MVAILQDPDTLPENYRCDPAKSVWDQLREADAADAERWAKGDMRNIPAIITVPKGSCWDTTDKS